MYWTGTTILAWAYRIPGFGRDLGTVAFTAVVALGTGLVFGLTPALHATRLEVGSALKDAGAGATSRSRLQRALIVAQIALTQPLLVGLALIVNVTISESNTGGVVHPLADRIARVSFGIGDETRPNARVARVRSVMDRVAQLPGVEAVLPEPSGFAVATVHAQAADRGGAPDEAVVAQLEGTPPGYFAFQRIPTLRGRELTASDTSGMEMTVIIDSDMARGFWGADPIGKRLSLASRRLRRGRPLSSSVCSTPPR